jgi:hypothetical protein
MEDLGIGMNLNYYNYIDYKVDEEKTSERRIDLNNFA